jgi:hypothetical protein
MTCIAACNGGALTAIVEGARYSLTAIQLGSFADADFPAPSLSR